MAKINDSALHDFVTGEKVTEQVLDQNFKVLQTAVNDVDKIQQDLNIGSFSPSTWGSLLNTSTTFNQLKFGYVKNITDPLDTRVTTLESHIIESVDVNSLAIASDNAKGHTNALEIGTTRNTAQLPYAYPSRIANPVLPDAPVATAKSSKGIDLIAHWYNDFGLEYEASAADQANGAYTWYDWSWNFTSNGNYDPSRHPLLGWYQGDDQKTLDWQCYWLAEKGINAVIPAQDFNTATWATSSDKGYWLYQLFNNVKNFKSLNYVPWLKTTGTSVQCNAQHDDLVNNVVAVYKNVYCYQKNNKRYPAVFVWDQELYRGITDNYIGSTALKTEYKRIATNLKAKGYDGVCVMARGYDTLFSANELADLETNGVIMIKADYSTRYASDATYSNLFENYVNNVSFPVDPRTALTVQTSAVTHAPHPSNFNLVGSTPDLFRKVLQKAVDHVVANNMPKIITINNVSEWAESGAGLQPNKQDGFGYLDALEAVRPVQTKLNFTLPTPSVAINQTPTVIQGVNTQYGNPIDILPFAGNTLLEPVVFQVTYGSGFRGGENVKVRLQATQSDGTTTEIVFTGTAPATFAMGDLEKITLFKDACSITKLSVTAQTNYSTAAVPTTIKLLTMSR